MHDKIESSIGWRIWSPLKAVWNAWPWEWFPASVSAEGVPTSPTGQHCPNVILVFIKIAPQKILSFVANFFNIVITKIIIIQFHVLTLNSKS